ncbi:hypothetical protein B2M27_00975 [Kluyvera intermedia]|uniref:Uncharacterized protein n=1 Tax=Kluyvera intermedia TaxID=61648 RepID=A0ABX3ULL4_KLUIN|nr:hypothetical protein B2M27_00975 [Kluyvera intermedia]
MIGRFGFYFLNICMDYLGLCHIYIMNVLEAIDLLFHFFFSAFFAIYREVFQARIVIRGRLQIYPGSGIAI